jgi:hypothetical protein
MERGYINKVKTQDVGYDFWDLHYSPKSAKEIKKRCNKRFRQKLKKLMSE